MTAWYIYVLRGALTGGFLGAGLAMIIWMCNIG